jgi:hypothetical protein
MKKLLTSLALAAAFALLPAQAASADILDLSAGVFPDDELTALSSSGHHFAVGGGTTAIGVHFAFSAHCKSATGVCPAGSGTASGYAVVRSPVQGEAQGHVCAYQTLGPGAARLWIVVEKASGDAFNSFAQFPNLNITAIDNGGPPSGTPDLLIPQTQDACAATSGFGGGGPVVQGNVVVRP